MMLIIYGIVFGGSIAIGFITESCNNNTFYEDENFDKDYNMNNLNKVKK